MQTLIVLTIISLAAIYAGRRAWLAMKAARQPKGGCGSDCGCE